MAGGFSVNTRRKVTQLPAQNKPTGGGAISWQLPKTGLLSKIGLAIRATIAGSISAPNAIGFASIVRRVRVTANTGIDLINISGAGYAYLLQEMLEAEYFLAQGQNQGRTVVTGSGATANLDMVLPIAINSRDPLGLVMLQNEQTILTLTVEFEADATVATSATVTATVTPTLELFTVPVDPKDWPPLNLVHQILEDSQAVSGAGQLVYPWQRGNTYLQVAHGCGINVAGSDAFSRYQLRVNQSDYLQDTDITWLDLEHRYLRGRARPPGGIFIDLMGTSGLGDYGSSRDLFNSALVTDLSSVIQVTGPTTLYSVRRQLVLLS